MNKQITTDIQLSFLRETDSQFIYPIIDNEREYLREWLPWVDMTKSEDQVKDFYKFCIKKKEETNGFECLIKYDNQAVGQIGLHSIDKLNKSTSIGYWLSEKFQGKGIITQSCKEIINYCFEELDINRIEIKCATKNIKSNKIPNKLSFEKEGIMKQAELLNGKFVDLNLYAITKNQWENLYNTVYSQ